MTLLAQVGWMEVIDQLPVESLARVFVGGVVLLAYLTAPYLTYYLVSLPLRRRERASRLLDVVQEGLKRGQGIEMTFREVAACGDHSMGIRFGRVAERLASGVSFPEALEASLNYLPPQVERMLVAGWRLGDVGRVLPVCRRLLGDAGSQTRAALNYLLLLVMGILPVLPLVVGVLQIWVLPRFKMIHADLAPLGPEAHGVPFGILESRLLVLIPVGVMAVFDLCVVTYLAGPWIRRLVQPRAWPLFDWIACAIPWRWKRMQRDFCGLLALMLDAGLTETEALKAAADGVSNLVFQARVRRLLEKLEAGVSLMEGLREIDPRGELEWRMAAAARASGGFARSLEGWLGALDAQAFHQEQAAAQTLTSVMVILNGAVVGVFCVGVFQFIGSLIEEASLW